METACKVTTLGCGLEGSHVTWEVNYNKNNFYKKRLLNNEAVG